MTTRSVKILLVSNTDFFGKMGKIGQYLVSILGKSQYIWKWSNTYFWYAYFLMIWWSEYLISFILIESFLWLPTCYSTFHLEVSYGLESQGFFYLHYFAYHPYHFCSYSSGCPFAGKAGKMLEKLEKHQFSVKVLEKLEYHSFFHILYWKSWKKSIFSPMIAMYWATVV